MTTTTIEAQVQGEEDDPHAWATAASNYLQAYSVMQTAMSDGINVQGAISGLLGAQDALRSLAASATQVPEHWKVVNEAQRAYGGIVKAAINLIAEVDERHDTKDTPLKHTVPYAAVVALRAAIEGFPPAPQAATQVPPVAWRRPWDGDESDLGKFVYADTLEDMEDDAEHAGEYVPLYEHPPTGAALEAWKKRASEFLASAAPRAATQGEAVASASEDTRMLDFLERHAYVLHIIEPLTEEERANPGKTLRQQLREEMAEEAPAPSKEQTNGN